MEALPVKAPTKLIDAIDALARRQGDNRSDVVRELLREGLRARGYWPPAEMPQRVPVGNLSG